MGVNSPRQLYAIIEDLSPVPREALLAELEPGIDELDVWSFPKSVVDDRLVLVDGYGTSRVDDVSTRFGVGVYAVDCAEDELFLEVGEEYEVSVGLKGCIRVRGGKLVLSGTHLVDLDAWVFADNTSTTTWRIKQHPIESP